MIDYNKFILDNGLTVIHHHDESTRLCVLNLLYKVGSKNENPNKTGFAHLFEHLMFGGSVNVPDYDTQVQLAGGDNNAFTSNDITNYYITLPEVNIETGFWLESDRMLGLDFNPKVLEVQRSVVIEEFKERYLNQPYGDVWLNLLPLAYSKHPYSWATIGKEISHIEQASMDDVKSFFYNFYAPDNCILVVAGNISLEHTKTLCKKWFEPIPMRHTKKEIYEAEPVQTAARHKDIYTDVPADMIVKAYHMPGRSHQDYFVCDLLSDILGAGKSSRFYTSLVKENPLFSELDTYISGDAEPGLFIIEGKLHNHVTFNEAEAAIEKELQNLFSNGLKAGELEKVKNKTETNILFGDANLLNRAMKLAFAEYLGDINLVNTEVDSYLSVAENDILRVGTDMIKPEKCSSLYYHRKTK
ncbi:MAG: M16 family metallopeptidase [Bacteroidia bacterium]